MIPSAISIPLWLLFLVVVFLFIVMKRTVRSRRQKKRLPPGPRGLPIIGNLHQLGQLPHQSLWKLSEKYGPVIQLQLGTIPTVVVSSPETARQVLKVHDLDSCSRPLLEGTRKLSYNHLDVGCHPFDDYWKEVRKICVLELFNTKRVLSFQSIRDEEITKLINFISESACLGASVNLSEKLLTLTASITCKSSFGLSFQGSTIDNDRFQTLIPETLEILGSFTASDFFPSVGWVIDWLTGLHGRRERCIRDLDAFYEQAIDLHLQKTGEGHEDILDLLLKLERQQVSLGNDRLSRNHVKAILMDILLGGIDTTAITMTWAMTELARNPRVMKKVQAEIRHHIGKNGRVSLEDTNQLQYLRMVIKETWRLHPPAPLLIPREAMSEFQINGYTIYPKTRLEVNVWGIGRDPNAWKDPEEFFPERFIDSSIDAKGQNFELLPFGGGRRICPGMYMGTVVVELTLANLLFHFDWKLPDGITEKHLDMGEGPGLTVYKKKPLELVPIRYITYPGPSA